VLAEPYVLCLLAGTVGCWPSCKLRVCSRAPFGVGRAVSFVSAHGHRLVLAEL